MINRTKKIRAVFKSLCYSEKETDTVLQKIFTWALVSQRVTINCMIDINRSSMENCVLRKLGINCTPL